ncbi:M61 family metallopeptidase [Sphingobacterium spiritivorum]|uniref:M61 family metallopeptidase n=1 Tax=Sphingobacterium spiritivorum TaxID=258 RepID=UPI001919C550|nr:PDZ domain-containing protein [Sphingobacterium spiritivorum]QQT24533.1 M61 family metallopeptidase [Sphingobacterium spiritivorum]
MANSSIAFQVSFSEPQAHYADIKMSVSNFNQDYIDVKMPVWTPGSYLIREYAKNLESFRAKDADDKPLAFEKLSKNTWRVFAGKQDIHIDYRVYCFEVSVRTNFVDDTHAFIVPAATFFYIDGHLSHDSEVTLIPYQNWDKISTGLAAVQDKTNTYYAPDFDILFDSPIEVGNQDIWHFEAAGIPHEFAMVGGGNYDKDRLSQDLKLIIEEETSIWGTNPNDRYVFITHNYYSGGGGLEHLNSTVLGATRNGYNQETIYKNFLSLAAHEYFHLWNVKRLRPKALGPFDYEAENYTTGLWIMEGFTAYYDNHIIRRCGFTSEDEYLQLLAAEFNTVYNRPGYELQSVGMSSFDTWIKQYRPDENSINTSISYYNKGAMLACALDLSIIAHSNGKQSLDDVIRAAYQRFYVEKGRGFEEEEFRKLTKEVTGQDFQEIFEAVYAHEELDYNRYFNLAGYEMVDTLADAKTHSLGIVLSKNDQRVMITHVERGSTGWAGGLSVKDELIAINDVRLDPAGRELEYALNSGNAGDTLNILVARDGLMRELKIMIGISNKKSLKISPLPAATAQQKQLAQYWLNSR